MVRKVKETLGETKARLRYELEQRTLDRIASLHIEAKATAKKKVTGIGGKTTASNPHSRTINILFLKYDNMIRKSIFMP
jgi:hypothetical protein